MIHFCPDEMIWLMAAWDFVIQAMGFGRKVGS